MTKLASEFYKSRARYDGLDGVCKLCKKAYDREPTQRARHAEQNVGWRARSNDISRAVTNAYKHANRDKTRAHWRVWRAVKDGRLVRPDRCERCGAPCKPNAHHADYSKPLAVEWLCSTCHGKEHRHADHIT